MRYLLTILAALGCSLSCVIAIKYQCAGEDVFPDYYGSPFIFKKQSLGSSMQFFYSYSGVLLNTIIWSFILFFLHFLIEKIVSKNKLLKLIRIAVYSIFMLFAAFNIWFSIESSGRGFNAWRFDLEKEAAYWRMECNGKWGSYWMGL